MEKRNIKKDLKKLADAFYERLTLQSDGEGWSIGLDSKRPFGNSSVPYDILEIIGCEDTSEDSLEYARTLYQERLVPYLKEKYGKD